ncbi:Vps62-related protein [Candidatus Dependentiae bacterium]|nr:Vps62-related protein [Candidatus Dependentiae bacterium]
MCFYKNHRKIFLIILSITTISSIKAGTTLPETTVINLAQTFAPEVRFHKKESYYPSSIDWFAKRCELRKRNPNGSTTLVLERPINDSSILKNYPTKDYPNGFNQINDYYLAPTTDKITRAGEPLVNKECKATCYYHIQDKHNDGIVIQYIFFYPYQGDTVNINILGKKVFNIGSHEGDIEHIDVHLRKTDELGNYLNYKLDQVHYAAHGNKPHGKLLQARDVKIVDKTHPIIWAAQWGHASHEKNVIFDIDTLDHTSNDGVRWKCWESPCINLGDRDKPAKGQEWLLFGGRLGATKEVTDKKLTTKVTNSPVGPSIDSPWWRHSPKQYDLVYTIDAKIESGKANGLFNLKGKIPTRVRTLQWRIIKPEQYADDIIFSVNERRFFPRKDRKNIYGPMNNNTVTKISKFNKGLYIADVKTKSGKKISGNITVRIYAIEE